MIPGSNILNMALNLVGRQQFEYVAFKSRAVNSIGLDEATYYDPVPFSGSVQAVPRTLMQYYGLDMQRNYLTFFVTAALLDVTRDVSGDQIYFNNKTYQCISKTDWKAIDGWISILAVEVPC